MKVLHVIPSVAPLRGGPSVAVLAMCRALADEGVSCDVVATNDNGPGLLDLATDRWIEHESVRCWFLSRFSPSWPIAVREFAFARGAGKWLRNHLHRYDLLHVHALFSHLPSCAMRSARAASIPYILRPLGILEDYSMQKSRFKKQMVLAAWDRANLRGAAAIHWTSERECKASSAAEGQPGWIVPLGTDIPSPNDRTSLAQDHLLCKDATPHILFLSRWTPKKRIEMLLGALTPLQDREWRLILAGATGGTYEAQIRAAIAQSGLKNRIETPGFLQGLEKHRALASAALFVLPSASENFAIAVAEAMAWGVPCVVSSHVGLAEALARKEAGWVVGDTAADLRDALGTALDDPAERRRRGENAARFASTNLSWSSCARSLKEKYYEVLGGT